MKLSECLNVTSNSCLLELLNNGATVSLCDDLFRIIKDKNSKEKDALTLDSSITFESYIIYAFLFNIPTNDDIDEDTRDKTQDLIYEFNEILDFNNHLITYRDKYDKKIDEYCLKSIKGEKTEADLLEIYFLELKIHPFYKSSTNKYLEYMIPGVGNYIDSCISDVYTLLFKCDCCGDIYDIVDFVDIKSDTNICKYCYNKYSKI